jgi:hypothetical protein
VELRQNNTVISAGATSRTLEGLKIEFPEVKEGKYLIKVYKKRGTQSRFVAYRQIEIKDNEKIIIFPKKEVRFTIQVIDQHNNQIKDVNVELKDNDEVIADNTTDETGLARLKVPRSEVYELNLFYKNILVYSDEIRLRISKTFIQNIKLYDLTVNIVDTLGLPPEVSLNPILIVTNPDVVINPDSGNNDIFLFSKLPTETYTLQLSYENTLDKKTHALPDDGEVVNIQFSATFPLKIQIYDARGNILQDNRAVLTRKNKELTDETTEEGRLLFDIPPGTYDLKIFDGNTMIREKNLLLLREKTLYLTTDTEPVYPLLIGIISLILIALGFTNYFLKKMNITDLFKLIVISLLFISLIQPWWMLNGESKDDSIHRTDINFLIPQIIVTKTIFPDDIISEPSNIPNEFSDFLFILFIMIILSCLLTVLSILLQKCQKISWISTMTATIVLILVIGIYFYAFSELTNVGLGGIQGSGTLTMFHPRTNEYVEIMAYWGVSYGFLICIISIFIYIITWFFNKNFIIFRGGK